MGTDISAAVRALMRGEAVVLPTETVYGLAANALDPSAVGEIFRIKSRPFNDPLIVHLLDGSWIGRYANVGSHGGNVRRIVGAFWPGPVTIVLKKKKIIPDIVTAGLGTVALRCPCHEIFRSVLGEVNFPLAAPSANPFGYVSPTGADQVVRTMGDRVGVIIDGGRCAVGVESTIVDLSKSPPRILRAGPVTADEISSAIGADVIDYEHCDAPENPNVPGQLKQHYCTHTKLVLFELGSANPSAHSAERIAVVFMGKPGSPGEISEKLRLPEGDIFWLSEDGDWRAIAKNLFATLQQLDGAGYDVIMCERPSKSGIGAAIGDRLTRAAAKFSGHWGST